MTSSYIKRSPVLTAIVSTWKEFTTESSIHGIKYINCTRPIDKWTWAVLAMISAVVSGVLVHTLYARYKNNPTRTVYETQFEAVVEFAFPAVTICAPRKFTKTNVKKLAEKFELPLNVTEEEVIEIIPKLLGYVFPLFADTEDLGLLDTLFELNSMNPQDIMVQLAPKCSAILARCRWEGVEVACSKIFKMSKTKEGLCCSFNFVTDFKGLDFNQTVSQYYGSTMGLSVIIDTLGDYNKQVYHQMDSFKILIHQSQSFAGRFTKEIVMPLRSEIHMALTPMKLISSPQIMDLDPEDRLCLFTNENHLKYFATYHKSDCIIECEIMASIERCGCLPFMYPGSDDNLICKPTQIPCLQQHFKHVRSAEGGKKCHCEEQCNENITNLEVHTVSLESIKYNMDPFYNKLSENQTVLHVYNENQVATVIKRAVITTWIDLISSFGGMFNLFLGCSFLSLLEVFYFILCKCPKKYWELNTANLIQVAEARKTIKQTN